MATGRTSDDLEEFQCPICLFSLDDPVRTCCGHVFCRKCYSSAQAKSKACPSCRLDVAEQIQSAIDYTRRMQARTFKCDGCSYQCTADKARAHEVACRQASMKIKAQTDAIAKSIRQTSGLGLRPLPNRQTFPCAYCGEANFDREALIEHCVQSHTNAPDHKLVCTICIQFPWGVNNQRSGHLLDHLKLRHRFDYDKFVDFEQTDEASLAEAIHFSADRP